MSENLSGLESACEVRPVQGWDAGATAPSGALRAEGMGQVYSPARGLSQAAVECAARNSPTHWQLSEIQETGHGELEGLCEEDLSVLPSIRLSVHSFMHPPNNLLYPSCARHQADPWECTGQYVI